MSSIADRLVTVFQDVFDDETLQLRDETTAADVEDWNSITHIDLIVAIERAFNIRFTTAEITGLKNVGELKDLIARKAA